MFSSPDNKQRTFAYPSGNRTTTFLPSVWAVFFPSSLFNHRKAPLKAEPLLPPMSKPSRRINRRAATKLSASEVFNQVSTVPSVRESTSGTKSYPMPSTMYAIPESSELSVAGRARMLPTYFVSQYTVYGAWRQHRRTGSMPTIVQSGL